MDLLNQSYFLSLLKKLESVAFLQYLQESPYVYSNDDDFKHFATIFVLQVILKSNSEFPYEVICTQIITG